MDTGLSTVTWTGVFVCGQTKETVVMKFRQATNEDILYHLKNLYEEKAFEGYALESCEFTGS